METTDPNQPKNPILNPIRALSLKSSVSAFDEGGDVVDDDFDHEFELLEVSFDGGESVAEGSFDC